MSFLVRSRNSQKWGGSSNVPSATSFSVRTGRRFSGETDSIVLSRSGAQDAVRDCLDAAHFLRNETQAARTAVEGLDTYMLKLGSFQDKAIELLEEAHRALSRLERAVALSAAPELIVVACEIKVACHRGMHLFRTYGKYRYLGKIIALATRSSITAKFDAVIGRLTAIMPLDRTPSFTSIRPTPVGPRLAAEADAGSVRAGSSVPHCSTGNSMDEPSAPEGSQQQALGHGSGNLAAAAGALAAKLKGGGSRGSGDAAAGAVLHHISSDAGAGAVLSIVLRSCESAKVTCMSFVDGPHTSSASTCLWWAAGDCLEFFSTSTQSTTSFAPHTERAAITAVVVDSAGNIWCANTKGAVMMRQQRNWEQVFVERAFSSSVRCLAMDADSDVVWAGDEAGRLAVFRFVEVGNSCHLECTATILPGRAGAGLKANSQAALLDTKPKALSRWHALSCRGLKDQQGVAEGPIRVMLVRDDRAWVGGGRTDPWIGLFDAVLGTQLDMWSCGLYGSCLAMTSMLTADALAETTAAATAAQYQPPKRSSSEHNTAGLDVPCSVPEDNIGEDPRSSWRLITGHESGQLLLWNAAADRLQPLVKIGEPGLSPVRALSVMEEQGLLAVVHANGDLALFLRPARDRDWLMGPATQGTAGGFTVDGSVGSGTSGVGVAAGATGGGGSCQAVTTTLQGYDSAAAAAALTSGGGAAASDRGRSTGGGSSAAAPAGLTTIKPRRVVLRSHRSMLVAAAACSSGVATASALGAIKLWPADGLGKEAERCGLLPAPLHAPVARDSSLSARSLNGRLTAATRTNSDSLLSSARSPMEMSPASGVSPPMSTTVDPAVLAATAAAVNAAAAAAAAAAGSGALVHSSSSTHPAGMGSCQQQQAFLAQQQQQQSLQAKQLQMQHEQVPPAALASWHQQSMQPQDSMVHPHHQLFGMPPYQQQDRALPGLARMSEPGAHVLQQLHQQQPPFFIGGAGSHAGALPEQVTNPLVQQQQQQQMSLERRSAPLDIPWQGNMVQPTAAGAAAAGMGTAMYARLTAQHQLGQLGSSPRFNSGNGMLSEAMVGSAGSPGAVMLAGQGPNGSFHGPHGTSSMPDVGFDVGSGPRYAAPRAPKALREREAGMNRERRRSERRLSKGANIAWSTCQIINASELQMLECIGGGAYGQVFLAEWMGTQVAAKQLLSLQNKAKDEVTKRKAKVARATQHSSRDDNTDSDSDTDSVDSVEEEVAAELKQLMDEVWVLGSLSHPSITRFCALCLDPPTIVMQYYPHGSLFDLLKRGRRNEKRALHELTWTKRLDMLRDIASGMVFLHSRKPPIVHGDLRSPNLLLDLTIDRDRPRFHVKIADFGLARMVGPTSSIAVSKVTNPRWSAPEVLRSSTVSLMADVFSFAVVMWEMLTWQQPYEDMMSVQVLFSVMQNYRPEIPSEEELPGKPGVTLPRYLSLMERCWAEDEHARPTFEEVLAELDDLRNCELGAARLVKNSDSTRSLYGSTRVSYSEAPGTPTGSCHGSSVAHSQPGSAVSSAPNSGRDAPGAIALAAAAAAGAAAASAAATGAALMRRRVSMDSNVSNEHLQQQQMCPTGTLQAWRAATGSDPGTPSGSGTLPGASGAAAGVQGDRRQQPAALGPVATSAANNGGSGGTAGTQPGCIQPGPPLAAGSELSFAMRAPPLLGTSCPVGTLASSPGPPSPGAALRAPSRLGPSRCSSTIGSPTAVTYGMAVRHDPDALLAETAADVSPNARSTYQRLSSGNGGLTQPLVHSGSRLRRLSWGTLEGSLQSNSSSKLGPQLSRASWAGSTVHEYPQAGASAEALAADRPYSPFAAAQEGNESSAVISVAGPFAGLHDQSGPQGRLSAVQPQLAAAAAAGFGPAALQVADLCTTARAANPFAAAQVQQSSPELVAATAQGTPSPFAQALGQVSFVGATAGGAAALFTAGSGGLKAPPRPTSPFAAVQDPDSEADALPSAALAASAAAAPTVVPARPCSPFAAAQRGSSGEATHSSARSCSPLNADSRQDTDDSSAGGVQPPARPSSPTAEGQLTPRPEVAAAGPASPGVASLPGSQQQSPRPTSPFAAVQEQPLAASAAGVAAPQAQPARPRSPFAAAQEEPWCQQQQQQQPYQQQAVVSPGEEEQVKGAASSSTQASHAFSARGESLTGSPFLGMDPALIPGSRSGSHSSQVCFGPTPGTPAAAAAAAGMAFSADASRAPAAVHNPSRLAVATGAWPVNTAGVDGYGQHSSYHQAHLEQQQQQQGQLSWRGPPSPFAGVNALEVQGPIVAQQARAVLSQLDSHQQQQQQPPLSATAMAYAGPPPAAAAAPPASSTLRSAFAVPSSANDGSSSALQAASAMGGPQLDRVAQLRSAAAAAGTGGGPTSSGLEKPGCVSGSSITFPSGLGAVESVTFLRPHTK